MHPRTAHPAAFTLLELVLVLMVMTVLLAVAAPSLRGWSRGAKLRDAADQFLAATRFARSQAVSTASVHRVEIDSASGAYAVTAQQAGAPFAPAAGEFGQVVRLAGGIRIDSVRDDGDAGNAIEFFPTGRLTPARVRLTADWGETVELLAPSPAEPFRMVSGDAP